MSLLKNNLISLVWYVGIGVGVCLLTGLPQTLFGNHLTSWELVFSIPILIVTPFLFILAGRYALKTQGSSLKDLVSVLLVCIIGFLATPNIAYFKPPGLCGNTLYFLYLVPLDATIQVFINDWDALMIGKGIPGLISGGICSFIPTLLMWIGLRWRSRKQPSL